MALTDPVSPATPLSTVSVSDTADRLGVSERTIYRWLKSGKITSDMISDNKTDVSAGVKAEISKPEHIVPDLMSKMSVIMSDIIDRKLERDLRAKDEQIERLIASQSEMSRMIARLQEQVFELACLVVRQRSDDEVTSEATEREEPRKGWMTGRLFNRR